MSEHGSRQGVSSAVGRVAAVFDAAPIGVAVWTIDGELAHANPVMCDLLGGSRDDLVGRRLSSFLSPAWVAALDGEFAALWAGRRNHVECELCAVGLDGDELWVRAQITPVYGAGGTPDHLISQVFSFASAPAPVDRSGAPGVDELARMADATPVMLWLSGVDGVPQFGNRRVFEFIGRPHGSGPLPEPPFERMHPDDLSGVVTWLRARVLEQRPFEFTARSERHDGEWRWLHHRAVPLHDDEELFVGYAGASFDVTEQETLRRELDEMRMLFHRVTEDGPVAVARADHEGNISYANGRWSDLLDDAFARLRGDGWKRLLRERDVEELYRLSAEAFESGQPFGLRVQAADPDAFASRGGPAEAPWGDLRVAPVISDYGEHDGWIVTVADVTAEVAASSRADRLARVLDAGSDFLMIVERNGMVSYVNDAARQALGVRGPDDAGPVDHLIDVLDPDSYERYQGVVQERLSTEGIWRGELVCRGADGQEIPVSALFLAETDSLGLIESVSVVARDITDIKLAERRLRQLATHDYLTGLPNRVLLYDRLDQALARFQRYGHPVSLLYLDLDRFKPVNDELGHHVGDAVLVEVAERIDAVVRDTDTAARIGGDEFAVLVEGIADLDLVRSVAERLIEVLGQPVLVDGHEAVIGVSIGLVAVDEACADIDALMARADAAMYRAKAAGRGRCVVLAGDRPR